MPAMRVRLIVPCLALLLVAFPAATQAAGELTFLQRVEAQRALERVRYSHQEGATLPFERAVPRELLERKVTTYLRQSAALDQLWDSPITAAMLQAELRRMARATRMPGRLKELFAALGDDPGLIQECLVRPVLADRLARRRFASDPRIRDAEGSVGETTWDAWWSEAQQRFEAPDLPLPEDPGELPQVDPEGASVSSESCVEELWDNASLDDPTGLPPMLQGPTTVWTGVEMIVWGGPGQSGPSKGVAYNPTTDTWRSVSQVSAPSPRELHTAIWTGTEMIVWGGLSPSPFHTSTGGRYNPVSDTWSPINAPQGAFDHVAVWTGTRMIVQGGRELQPVGPPVWVLVARTLSYDPATNTWTFLTDGAPRTGHAAAWTGSLMVVWGGGAPGSSYSTASNTWTLLPTAGAPTAAVGYHVLWTGSRVIVWGGGVAGGGALYNPAAGSWSPITTAGAPPPVSGDSAVWAGTEMIVWGSGDTGRRYDPSNDIWTPISTVGAPLPRSGHAAAWSGSQMIIMYGSDGEAQRSWARYEPATDSWILPELSGAPNARITPTTLWTGNVVIVWGGGLGAAFRGSRYDPILDVWSPMTNTGAPTQRGSYGAIWAGNQMIIWGGNGLNTGGRYDPVADAWAPTSLLNAPVGRYFHSTVWTGQQMVVWGGYTQPPGCSPCSPTHLNTGGRYDPILDLWTPTSTTGAPEPRYSHVGLWVDGRMVIWGGAGNLVTGGRYDPSTDAWFDMSETNVPARGPSTIAAGATMITWGAGAPVATGGIYSPSANTWSPTPPGPNVRSNYSAVWTGSEMVVWGGRAGSVLFNDGWRLDPAAGTWTPTTVTGAPAARIDHGAAWMGDRMFVWGGSVAAGAEGETGGMYHVPQPDADQDSWCAGLDCDDAHAAVFPGAPQICGDGLNNDCDDPAWPALPPAETDGDGDGLSECQGDCDDAQPAWWQTPGDFSSLMLSPDGTLSWLPPVQPGAVSLEYDVLRALDHPSAFSTTAECLESHEGSDTAAVDMQLPPVGAVMLYLVHAINGCGAGPASIGSNGDPLPAISCP